MKFPLVIKHLYAKIAEMKVVRKYESDGGKRQQVQEIDKFLKELRAVIIFLREGK